MEAKEYRNVIDKSGWGPGEWQDEPDKLQWPDADTGLPCLIVRGPHGGLCGYVGVTEDHPCFGKDYEHVPVGAEYEHSPHGGITYADKCNPADREERGICHVPGPGEPDHVWWLGFDCAHAGDYSPKTDARWRERWPKRDREVYRTVEYVRDECTRFASWLAHLAKEQEAADAEYGPRS